MGMKCFLLLMTRAIVPSIESFFNVFFDTKLLFRLTQLNGSEALSFIPAEFLLRKRPKSSNQNAND